MFAPQVPICLNWLHFSSYGSWVCEILLVRCPFNMYLYFLSGNRLLQVILIIACMIGCILEAIKNLFVSIVINSYLLLHAYGCCKDDNLYECYLPPGSNCPYLLYLTIGTLICGRNYWSSLHWLVLNCLITCQGLVVVLTLIVFLATCRSCVCDLV